MQQSAPAPVEAKPRQPKRVDLFTMLLAYLGQTLQPRGRRTKRKHAMSGRLPVRGITFRYRVTRCVSAVNENDRSWKGHHGARRLARAAA